MMTVNTVCRLAVTTGSIAFSGSADQIYVKIGKRYRLLSTVDEEAIWLNYI